jgi:O-acetyl-ADP-ribose deacetylase (regulator of RNase III)
MINIQYVVGDATNPIGDGQKIICHINNDIGAWGAGFVLALSRKWSEPEAAYRAWGDSGSNFWLGEVQYVKVENDITVANMIGQRGCSYKDGKPPINYSAVFSCLRNVANMALSMPNVSIHMPRIGCGLAGGEWSKIEEIITETLSKSNIPVYVYDLE